MPAMRMVVPRMAAVPKFRTDRARRSGLGLAGALRSGMQRLRIVGPNAASRLSGARTRSTTARRGRSRGRSRRIGRTHAAPAFHRCGRGDDGPIRNHSEPAAVGRRVTAEPPSPRYQAAGQAGRRGRDRCRARVPEGRHAQCRTMDPSRDLRSMGTTRSHHHLRLMKYLKYPVVVTKQGLQILVRAFEPKGYASAFRNRRRQEPRAILTSACVRILPHPTICDRICATGAAVHPPRRPATAFRRDGHEGTCLPSRSPPMAATGCSSAVPIRGLGHFGPEMP